MVEKTDGGSAFPRDDLEFHGGNVVSGHYQSGMSLRDWFAGQALAGQIAACSRPDLLQVKLAHAEKKGLGLHQMEAKAAYKAADAMLEARK